MELARCGSRSRFTNSPDTGVMKRKALKLERLEPGISVSTKLPVDTATSMTFAGWLSPLSLNSTELCVLLVYFEVWLGDTLRRSTWQTSFALRWLVQVLTLGFQAYFIPALARLVGMPWEEIYNTFWFHPTPNHYVNTLFLRACYSFYKQPWPKSTERASLRK